jgi:hypothetical protein
LSAGLKSLQYCIFSSFTLEDESQRAFNQMFKATSFSS